MPSRTHRRIAHLRQVSEAVPALLLAAMFLAFIVQVFMRYVMDSPVGWTVEVCVIAWIWVILWGQSLSATEADEIRFDIVYSNVTGRTRRVFRMIFSAFLVGIYAISLPAAWDYVTFMKIEETSYLDIPYSWVFAVFILFAIASILRYLWIFWTAATDRATGLNDPDDLGTTRKDFVE